MSKLFQAYQDTVTSRYTITENGALTLTTSGSNLVDLFSRAGGMKTPKEEEVIELLSKALDEDVILAITILFHIRNIRGGYGFRSFFEFGLRYLGSHPKYHKIVPFLYPFIPVYGRYTDFFALLGTLEQETMLNYIANQFLDDDAALKDYEMGYKPEANISLLAKWLPSEKSNKYPGLYHLLLKDLGIRPKTYRKMCSALRKHLNIVESKMCDKQWDSINYEAVPSRAMLQYHKAFSRNDSSRYLEYLKEVNEHKAKINAGTLFPADIVTQYQYSGINPALEALWGALPDYRNEHQGNALVVVDGSGSMYTDTTPSAWDVAASLGIYFAERNTGVFEGKLITFSTRPEFIDISKCHTLLDKIQELAKYGDIGSTNIQAVFDLILGLAESVNLPESEMPSILYIVSDMQFDVAVDDSCSFTSNYDLIQDKYEKAGYKLPKIVFWNVNCRVPESPVPYHQTNTVLVSGYSPSVFKQVVSDNVSPLSYMLETISDGYFDLIANLIQSFEVIKKEGNYND